MQLTFGKNELDDGGAEDDGIDAAAAADAALAIGGKKRNRSTVFSPKFNTLFTGLGTSFPLTVHLAQPAPPGSVLRYSLQFSNLMDAGQPVVCCPLHSSFDERGGLFVLLSVKGREPPPPKCRPPPPSSSQKRAERDRHILRIMRPETVYVTDPSSGCLSAVLPCTMTGTRLEQMELLKCICLTSCAGGPNRRPFDLIVSLEHSGRLLDMVQVRVRSCACPFRDYKNQRWRYSKGKTKNQGTVIRTPLKDAKADAASAAATSAAPGADAVRVQTVTTVLKRRPEDAADARLFDLPVTSLENFVIARKVASALYEQCPREFGGMR